MDFLKLSGITQAIESESKLPMPSHANLARLLCLAIGEIIALISQVESIKESKSPKLKSTGKK